ncbi:MAG: TonB-dependent receptor plug domain-containing protein [Pseudomonadota bacterium]|nr:TonB-dependent receptor plug domain-containing protein [Pseudomonadota bacterium]
MAKGGKAALQSAARAAAVFLALTGTVWAADGGRKEDAVRLGDITVTANKMEEDLQKVPQSVTVISEEELEEKGIRNVMDVIREIPNMTPLPTKLNGNMVSFRGLGVSAFTNNNPVIIYIDGVPQTGRMPSARSSTS